MSQARQVVAWLQQEWPSLPDLTEEGVRSRLMKMKGGYTDSSLRHFLIKTHLLLDQAVRLGMISRNPAREVRLRRDLNVRLKPARERRILTEPEVARLLRVSLKHRSYLNGGLPAVVRLGLYAGLRNEEMCWLKWECIDWDLRILTIQESVCELTRETWVPKDYELRRIDVKQACIDYLSQERERQRAAGLDSPFVLPAGRPQERDPSERRKHLHPNAPSKAFARMIRDARWDETITVYSLRHTYATMALRAGVDLRTLQKRMGHSDIKTTMEYLHYIEPEQHPMDCLPY
jgi:integrase